MWLVLNLNQWEHLDVIYYLHRDANLNALCLSLPLIPMLVSEDSAMGLLCGWELLDALRGTTFGETAGIW